LFDLHDSAERRDREQRHRDAVNAWPAIAGSRTRRSISMRARMTAIWAPTPHSINLRLGGKNVKASTP